MSDNESSTLIKTTSAKTGDTTPIVWLIVVMIVCACGFAVLKKKKEY